MNPPRDADAGGSPSNCCAFFISAVRDLSLHEIHTASSAHIIQQKFIFSYISNTLISPCPTVSFQSPILPPLQQLRIPPSLFWSVCLHLSATVLIPPSQFVSMAGSVFSADVPLVSSGLAGRQQKWLWDWGDGSLVVTDTELLWWAFNSEGQTEEEKVEPENKRLWNFLDIYYLQYITGTNTEYIYLQNFFRINKFHNVSLATVFFFLPGYVCVDPALVSPAGGALPPFSEHKFIFTSQVETSVLQTDQM